MRHRAAAMTKRPAQILSRCSDELEDSVAAQLLRLSTLKRDIQRVCVRAGNVPENPGLFCKFEPQEKYHYWRNGHFR